MTDRALADALTRATAIEREARDLWASRGVDYDAALVVVRHATALRKSLESWLAARAVRAAVQS
jgi:hypothetical protein